MFPGTENLDATQLREARRHAVEYMYQLDATQKLSPQESDLELFFRQFGIPPAQFRFIRGLSQGVIANMQKIDELISSHSKNWKLSRIAKVDLAVLRVCTLELLERPELATEMLLADAAEIGKQYGTAHSSSFINGVLDGVAKNARPAAQKS